MSHHQKITHMLCRSLPFLVGVLLALSAQGQHFAISARVGTLGPGLELGYQLHPKLNLRAGGNYLNYSRTFEVDVEDQPLAVDWDIQLKNFSLIADLVPFGGAFRLSGGVVLNRNQTSGFGRFTEPISSGGAVFQPEEVGQLSGTLSFSEISGYAGIGFGNTARGNRVGLILDIGALYHGAPKLSMNATEMLEPNNENAAIIQENIKQYAWYPVVSLGFSIRL